MRRPHLLALVLALGLAATLAPSSARAGGDLADLALGQHRAWLASEDGLRSVDLRTGRLLPASAPAPGLPISVTLAGGAAWIATIENGYVDGRLVRIDPRSGRARVLWHRADSSVQAVASGAGSVWALIGSRHGMRLARFALDGRLLWIRDVAGAGRIAADDKGCWVSTWRWLLRVEPAGTLHRVLRAPLGDLSARAGVVWLPAATSVLRYDESTGKARRIRTGRLGLGGFQHDLAAGPSALFALRHVSSAHSELLRLDTRTGRTTSRAELPGNASAVAVDGGEVWAATVLPPASGTASGYALLRYDASTLRRTLRVDVP